MTHTVVGLFEHRTQAQAATQELIQRGYMRENIDVSNRRYEGAANNSMQVTVTEPTISDDIKDFFNSLFNKNSASARNYSNAAVSADSIISIQVDSVERAKEVAAILDHFGAIDVDGHTARYDHQGFGQQNFAPGANPNTAHTTTERTVPIIEEQLQVNKHIVDQGETRVRSRIIEKPVEANMRLRDEHVVVNRRPVDRAVTQEDLANFKDEEIILTERAEVPVISKQARVVEEIVVGKEVREHNEVIQETVRRTDVEVDKTHSDSSNDIDLNNRRASVSKLNSE